MNTILIWTFCICTAYFIIHGCCLFCHTGSNLIEINDFFVTSHNYYRRIHNVPPLMWNEKLMNDSLLWSRLLAKTNKMQLSHSEGNYGENLWKYEGSDRFSMKNMSPVKSWYEEIDEYSFEDNESRPKTAHFTQVVWRNSRLLGCGVCTNANVVYVTCRYVPVGNVAGEFLQNIEAVSGLSKVRSLPIVDILFSLLVIIFSASALASLFVYVINSYWLKKLGRDSEQNQESEEEKSQN